MLLVAENTTNQEQQGQPPITMHVLAWTDDKVELLLGARATLCKPNEEENVGICVIGSKCLPFCPSRRKTKTEPGAFDKDSFFFKNAKNDSL